MGRKYIDLTGYTTNGGVFVKHIAPTTGGAGKHKRWICECPICKEEFEVQSNHIIGDQIKSCKNCANKEFEDLSGQRFYYLTVEKRLYEYTGTTMYQCKCDCGNTHIASGSHLRSGTVRSCGCLKSSYEQTIKQILEENQIQYEKEKVFKDCGDEKRFRFDFYIPELNILIEMHGEQHYKAVEFWGGEKGFEKRKRHDKIKEEYCKDNGYKLLVIKYNEDIEQRVNEEIVWPLQK